MTDWEVMLARSFNPTDWFQRDEHPDLNLEGRRVRMWVYRKVDGNGVTWAPGAEGKPRFVVGFYEPKGDWIEESEQPNREAAAARVSYLNGGAA